MIFEFGLNAIKPMAMLAEVLSRHSKALAHLFLEGVNPVRHHSCELIDRCSLPRRRETDDLLERWLGGQESNLNLRFQRPPACR